MALTGFTANLKIIGFEGIAPIILLSKAEEQKHFSILKPDRLCNSAPFC